MEFGNFENGPSDQEESDDAVDITILEIERIFSDERIKELNSKFSGTEDQEDAFDKVYEIQQQEAKDVLITHSMSKVDIDDLAYRLISSNQMLSLDNFIVSNEDGQEEEVLLDLQLAERLELDGHIPELKDNAMKFDPEAQKYIEDIIEV